MTLLLYCNAPCYAAGAGVAALLALHYRSIYPSVRVWCFAPPGGLMSPAAATSLKDICYSVVSAKVSSLLTKLRLLLVNSRLILTTHMLQPGQCQGELLLEQTLHLLLQMNVSVLLRMLLVASSTLLLLQA
jgi:hypothetical protein